MAQTSPPISANEAMNQIMQKPINRSQIKPARSGGAAQRAKAMPRAERRKQLLAVARKIVAKDGIGALTMAALAERAGVSKPVVYENFDNSESVAIALLDEYFETAVEAVDTAARDAVTLGEYLSRAVDAEFDINAGDTLFARAITNGYSSSERLNKAYRKLRKITLETFQDLLAQQGVEKPVAATAGFVLAEMMTSTVFEYASKRNNLIARETLKAMLNGAVSAIVPLQKERPQTPAKTLATYRRLKKLHES